PRPPPPARSRREDPRPVPGQVAEGHEPGRVTEGEDREIRAKVRVVRHHRDPVAGAASLRLPQGWAGDASRHFDLGQAGARESFTEHDVGTSQILLGERNRIPGLGRALEQHPFPGGLEQDALGLTLLKMPPGVLAFGVELHLVGRMFDGHHAELPAPELVRQRHQERGFPGVLASDDGDYPGGGHARSARSTSSGELTLKKRRAGSPKVRTRASGSVPTRTSSWKAIARTSPWAMRRSMAGAQERR